MTTEVYSKEEVDDLLDAIPAPPPDPGGAGLNGVVQLDSFEGSNDDAKLDAALSYAGAQSMVPYVQFPARKVNLNKGGRVPFTGMKIIGPWADGPKNLEISSGKPVNHKVMLGSGVGSGAKSLFVGGSTYYDVYVANLAIQGSYTQQFWSQPTGTLYACEFHSLNFYGMYSCFGNQNEKCLLTQVAFTGFWTVLGSKSQQFHMGGSDNDFWVSGFCNTGGNHLDPNEDFNFRINGMGKSRIGSLYLTAGSAKGIRLSGASENAQLELRGVRFEGYHSDTPATTLVQVDSGIVLFDGGDVGYAATPILQKGGILKLNGLNFERGSSQSQTAPLLVQEGGTAYVWAPTVTDGGPLKWQGSNVILGRTRRHRPRRWWPW